MSPLKKTCDYLVIGGGSGGLASARRASRLYGASCIIVEHKELGGTCVNVGCIPKKITWQAASIRDTLKSARQYGFGIGEQQLSFDWTEFCNKRTAVIKRLNAAHETNLVVDGVEYLSGLASFADPHTVLVNSAGNTVEITAKTILIAVGGQPKVPEIDGAALGITSDGFFELIKQPKKIAIFGAGYIAVEMAGMAHALGTETHLFFRHQSMLRSFDPMIQDEIMAEYERQGIHLHKGASMLRVDETQNGRKRLHYKDIDGSHDEEFDCILWAIGRVPQLQHLNLEVTNVKYDAQMHIEVDKYQNTNVEHIKCLGDACDRGFELTPVAIAAGRRLADRLFGSAKESFLEYETIPSVVFAHPEIGTIGMTEPIVRKVHGQGNIKIYRSSFTPLFYAIFGPDASRGRASYKLICAGPDERIVGLHIIGLGSSEMLQGFGVAIRMGATKKDFDRCVAIHPTSAEELVTLT